MLTLEIIIDLQDPIKSIQSHLEMTVMDSYKYISHNTFNALMNLNSVNENNRTIFEKQFFNAKDNNNKKALRIIDLRKNEHFGDVLMILNEKSPLTVKVKSKKAELFFLQKTEAIEISNRYSNIWKRIVNRSLHNMKQIKNLIKKKLFLFIETYNIQIDPELKKHYLMNNGDKNNFILPNSNRKSKSSKCIETILEEDENTNRNKSQSHYSEKNEEQMNKEEQIKKNKNGENKKIKEHTSQIKKKKIKDDYIKQNQIINDKSSNKRNITKNNNIIKNNTPTKEKREERKNTSKKTKKNYSFKEDKISVEFNYNINVVNNLINTENKEIKNVNENNRINSHFNTLKIQFPLQQMKGKNINKTKFIEKEENHNNSSNTEKINNEISFDNDFLTDISKTEIMMNNSDENTNLFYKNETTKIDNTNNKEFNNNDNHSSNICKLFKRRKTKKNKNINKIIKDEIENIKTNDKVSIKSFSSDKIKVINKNKDNLHKFSNLNTNRSSSFTISSIYDNINQISKFNYHINPELREKTKIFILEEIDKGNKNKTSNINKKTNNLLDIKTNIQLNKNRTFRIKSDNLSKFIPLNNTDNIISKKPPSVKFDISIENNHHLNISKSSKKLNENSNILKNTNQTANKEYKRSDSMVNIHKKRNLSKKKTIRKYESTSEKDNTFFNKIKRLKTMKKTKDIHQEVKSERENRVIKLNYNKLISKNIEKNQQNLNNPEEYFEGFFNDIILKTQDNNCTDDIKGKKRSSLGY